MPIEKRLRIVLLITLLSGITSILTILHISKGMDFYQANFEHKRLINELTSLLNRPESHAPSLYQVNDILYSLYNQSEQCFDLNNNFNLAIIRLMGAQKITSSCKNKSVLELELINSIEDEIVNKNQYLLVSTARDYLIDAPELLLEQSNIIESEINRIADFTAKFALIFIITFFTLVFILTFTIIKAVTRNAVQFRETAEALAQSEIKNRELAYYDQLTLLPNRNLLKDRLQETIKKAIRQNKSFAIMFLDLDRFKHINDTLGHAAGDELIQEAANRIKKSLRDSDTVARFGGDEFVLILPDLRSCIDVSTIATKIMGNFSEPFKLEGLNTYVTASIGIAIYPENGDDITTLFKHADIAMYQSKENGKNQFCLYNNEMNKAANKRLMLERDLRNGLVNNEFTLHYQPVVDLNSGNIIGVEALLRWQHPIEGMIPPDDFIPIAEDTGLIINIGYLVIDMACLQCLEWRNKTQTNFHVAINISARQLKDDHFVEYIDRVLAQYELPVDAIQIEITESAFYNNDQKSIETLRKLDKLNFKLLLDDFGTGFSSLSTLRNMPFDVIKIDRSFITTNVGKNIKITESILDLAQNFDMQVIAEGIETSEVADFLRRRGCQYGQGYLFKKPLKADELDLTENYLDLIEPTKKIKMANR